MRITYTISDTPPTQAYTQTLTLGLTINVNRDCPIGQRSNKWTIASLGDVPTVAAAILAWIAADTAGVITQNNILLANQAIQDAFELIIGQLTIEVDI